MAEDSASSGFKGAPNSVALLLFFVFWYVGNIYYNQYNKMALDAVGGKTGGLTMTVSTMQLGVCSIYALLLWLIGLNPIKICGLQVPDKMKLPKITISDLKATMPVGFCSACAHSAGVFCLGADPLSGHGFQEVPNPYLECPAFARRENRKAISFCALPRRLREPQHDPSVAKPAAESYI